MNTAIRLLSCLFAINILLSGFAYASDCDQSLRISFQKGELHRVTGAANVSLATYAFENPQSDKAIVLVPGLGDASELLEENIQDLYAAGFSVFILDHRGQGRSKIQSEHVNSHVDDYRNYVSDLDVFVQTVVRPARFKKTFMLGNSAGAAIGFLYLRAHPEIFAKSAFISPMFGMKISPVISNAMAKIGRRIQGPAGSFFTNLHFSFEKNTLTSDERRFQEYEGFFQANPEIPGYAPSHNWMLESNKMIADVHSTRPEDVRTPMLIFSSGKDQLVDNRKLEKLAEKFSNMSVVLLPESRHAPHFEQNKIRTPVLGGIINFFQ